MLPAAVLFDFSGTLFHIETAEQAVAAALGAEALSYAPALRRLGAINGSGTSIGLPDRLALAWARRDLSEADHRAAYSGLALEAGLTPEQAGRLYDRGVAPAAWAPYPDTVEVLRGLAAAGVPVALVSNIGWDPRPVLRAHGVTACFAILVLSYERGVIKPDPAIFALACEELGVSPEQALMVGDNPEADGGAVEIGCRFALLPADPDGHGHDGLLRAVGLAPGW